MKALYLYNFKADYKNSKKTDFNQSNPKFAIVVFKDVSIYKSKTQNVRIDIEFYILGSFEDSPSYENKTCNMFGLHHLNERGMQKLQEYCRKRAMEYKKLKLPHKRLKGKGRLIPTEHPFFPKYVIDIQ